MAQNPNPSLLSQQQILQRVFDETEDRLRIDTEATVTAGAMEVIIDSTSDSIQVKGDNGESIEPNADGSVNVELQVDHGLGATTSETLRTTANIAVNGVSLDVNIGTPGAATLRTAAHMVGKSVNSTYTSNRSDGVSTDNSTSTPLAGNGVFTGTWEDVLGYSTISIMVNASVASATDGLAFQYSMNGVDVHDTDYYTTIANNGSQFSVGATSRYFRIVYTNGATPQATFNLSTLYHASNIKPSSHRIDDSIHGNNDAELVKAVLTGKNPNGEFINVYTQGDDDTNSTDTPLNANVTYRGLWYRWSTAYVTLITTLNSDVSGTLYIDASDDVSPVDGDETGVDFSITVNYDPSEVSSVRRHTPIQSVWVRHRYVNGASAQTEFHLKAILTTSDPGSVYLDAADVPALDTLSSVGRSITTYKNAAGDGFQDAPIDSSTGDPKVTVQTVRDDILLKPMTSTHIEQGVVSITPVRIDAISLANRRKVTISNDGGDNCAIGFSSAITYSSASFVLKADKERTLEIDSSIELWAVAEDAGGVQTTLNRSGSSAAGTATNTSDALTSNNTYSTISAAAQDIEVTGFTAGTANPLVSVKLAIEAAKQSGQFETVAVSETQSGATAGAGTVASASLAGGSAQLYVAFITRNDATGTITQVLGGGNTFTALLQNVTSGNRRIDVWYKYGTFFAGTVVASLSASTNAHIAVYRVTNADGTTPIQTSGTATGTGTAVTGPAIAGTDKGYSILAISHTEASGTAGAGYTEQVDTTNGAGGNVDTLGVESKALTVTGAETATYTLIASSAWAAIGLTISPIAAYDPTVTLSYELSAVPGATTGLVTLSSTSDTTYKVDVTGDRAWVAADIANVTAIATGTTVTGAAAKIDHLFLELIDTTGNSTRISVLQLGRTLV